MGIDIRRKESGEGNRVCEENKESTRRSQSNIKESIEKNKVISR